MELFTMKKALPILLALLVLLTTTCFAKYKIDYDKWKPVPNETGLYWDKSTAQYSDGDNTVKFQICLMHPKGKKYVLSTYRITKEPRTVTQLDYEEYKKDKLINSYTRSPEEEFTYGIYPNSLYENLYCAVFSAILPSDKARWQKVISHKDKSYYLDLATLKYSDDGNIATAWTKCIEDTTSHTYYYEYCQYNKSEQTDTTLYSHWNLKDGTDWDFVSVPKEIKEQKYANDDRYNELETDKILLNTVNGVIFQAIFSN